MRTAVKCALALLAGGCVITTAYTPTVLVVPVTFESHLLAAQQCEFVGAVSRPQQADTLGANVVLAFLTDVSEHTHSSATEVSGRRGTYRSHGGTSGISYGTLNGKAMRCPEHVVAQLAGQAPGMAEVAP